VNNFRTQLLDAFYAADPIGLAAMGAPPDEYSPEVDDTLPRLLKANSIGAMRKILYESFTKMFDGTAGTEFTYNKLAEDCWRILR